MNRIPGILLVVCAALTAGCSMNGTAPDGSGTIECTQVLVSPQVAGRLAALPVREGDALHKGDLVARIDTADYVLKRDEAKAQLAAAQAQVALVSAAAREEDVQRAREQVREAKAAMTAAAADLTRTEEVFAKRSATQKQVDDARAMAERTSAALGAAEQSLARIIAGSRKEEIRVAQAQVDLLQVRLAQAEKALADCEVTAPMDGVVTTRNREEGEMVGVGTALITLSRLDEVWLSVYIPETRLGHVKLGDKARVRVDGVVQMAEGTVTFISPEAEFTPKNVQTPDERAKLVYRVKVTLKNADRVFKPGMPADGFLGAAE